MSRHVAGKAIAPRFEVAGEIGVQVSTLGSTEPFDFSVVDISSSGFLLATELGDEVPFHLNALLDITVDPSGGVLAGGIRCMGKLVRVVEPTRAGGDSAGTPGLFAVTIVQIDDDQQDRLDDYLKRLESHSRWETIEERGQYFMRRAK